MLLAVPDVTLEWFVPPPSQPGTGEPGAPACARYNRTVIVDNIYTVRYKRTTALGEDVGHFNLLLEKAIHLVVSTRGPSNSCTRAHALGLPVKIYGCNRGMRLTVALIQLSAPIL